MGKCCKGLAFIGELATCYYMLKRIQTFISVTLERGCNHFDENTSLEYDLGIWGDEAIELIVAFGKEFKVDVSEFIYDKHFSDEDDFTDVLIRKLLRIRTGRTDTQIKHLIKATESGVLNEQTFDQTIW